MREENLPPLDPQKGSWDEEAISRRRFLEIGFGRFSTCRWQLELEYNRAAKGGKPMR